MKCSHVMQTELPLDFISSRSVKYSHSSGFSNASTGEMNLAFFDHAIVPPMEKTKKAPCSLGASFAFVMGIKLIQTYYFCLLGQVFISWGTFCSSWGTFVGNFLDIRGEL